MSKTNPRKPYWQDAPCPSWCWGEHRDDEAVPDRTHLSRWENRTVVSQYSAHHGWYPDYPGGPDHEYCEPVELLVYLVQGVRESAPRVQVCPDGTTDKDSPGALNLTVTEAAKLAKTLAKAVRLAGGAQ